MTHFKPGDIVITPTQRRARLVELRYDGRWELQYLGPVPGGVIGWVALMPHLLKPA